MAFEVALKLKITPDVEEAEALVEIEMGNDVTTRWGPYVLALPLTDDGVLGVLRQMEEDAAFLFAEREG